MGFVRVGLANDNAITPYGGKNDSSAQKEPSFVSSQVFVS